MIWKLVWKTDPYLAKFFMCFSLSISKSFFEVTSPLGDAVLKAMELFCPFSHLLLQEQELLLLSNNLQWRNLTEESVQAFVFVAKHEKKKPQEKVHWRDWDHNCVTKVNSNRMPSPGWAGQDSPDLSMFPVQFSCPEQGFLPLWWFGDAGPRYLLQVEYLLGASGDWEWG